MERLVYQVNSDNKNEKYPYKCQCGSRMTSNCQSSDETSHDAKRTPKETLLKYSFNLTCNLLKRILIPQKVHCLSPRSEIDQMFEEYKDIIDSKFIEDEEKDGWQRVRRMWKGALYATSSEIEIILDVFLGSIFLGFVGGATVGNIEDLRKFKRRHNEMVFEGEYIAKRKYIDLFMVSMTKKGLIRAKEFVLFPTMFTTIALTAAVYRNYINPLDFAASGALAAALWRTMRGPKAQAAAALGGGAFGLAFGCLIWTVFWITGTTVSEYRRWYSQARWSKHQELSAKSWKKFEEKIRSSKFDEIREPNIIYFEHDDINKFRKDESLNETLKKNLEESKTVAEKDKNVVNSLPKS